MKLLVLLIWAAMIWAFYMGVRASLLPHQPRWQALAIVGSLCLLFTIGVGALIWLDQVMGYVIEDDGGPPEHPDG